MEGTKKHTYRKKGLFIFILLLLFIPLIQQKLELFPKNTLKGSFELAEKPELNTEKWFNGKFQSESQIYLNDHLGFRSFFVRLYNQIHYSFFNTAKANGVIVGKENYLYEENYIKAHLGIDYIGEKEIKEKVYKIKKIQDTLATKGIDLVIMLAPGKASFYPEYIPEHFYENAIDSTNYKTYKKEILANAINLLDFNKWFIDMKGKSNAPLYPKHGIHWSQYGQVLVADSLLNYIGALTQLIIPDIIIDSTIISSEMRNSDQDIEDGMNLLINIPDKKMHYPQFHFSNRIDSSKLPKVLAIGDSYFWGIFRLGIFEEALSGSKFWYYNTQIYPETYTKELLVRSIEIQTEIEKNDVILLMATDANLYKFAFGFIDDVYDIYYTKLEDRKSYKKEQRLLRYMEEMRTDPLQNQQIIEKSIRKGLSFEEELRNNAKYRIWVEDGKP